jgi:death on curing protein
LLEVNFVVAVHESIIVRLGGLPGFGGGGRAGLESALHRLETHAQYAGLSDALGIAGLHAEVLARGHVFNDGNKRTALTCALHYLAQQSVDVRKDPILEEATVMLADGTLDYEDFALLLGQLAGLPTVEGDPPAFVGQGI